MIRAATGILVPLLCSLTALAAFAESFIVSGIVRAPGGIPAPGVTITISGDAQGTTFTDDAGRFRVPLPPGKYKLRATLLAYSPQEKNIEIQATRPPGEMEFRLTVAPLPGLIARGAARGNVAAPANGDFQTLTAQAADEGPAFEGASQVPSAAAALVSPAPAPDIPFSAEPDAPNDAFVVAGNVARNIAPSLDFESGEGRSARRPRGGTGREGRSARELNPEERQKLRERFSREIAERRSGRGSGGPGGRPGGEGGPGGPGGGPGGFGGGAPGGGPGGFGGGAPGGGPGGGVGGFWGGGGGGGMNMNRLRGGVRLRYSNSIFDARPYSFSGQEQRKLTYYNENAGFTLGGPLVIPGLLRKESRTAFFLNYEESRARSSQDNTTSVPLPAQRLGDFSGGNIVYDPLTSPAGNPPGSRQPFAGNRIPALRINPAARELMNYIPLPNLPGDTLNYHLQQVLPAATDSLSLRVSRSLSQRTRSNISGSYTLTSSRSDRGQIYPGLLTHAASRGQNAMLGFTRMMSQRATNDLRLQFNRMRNRSTNDFAGRVDVLGPLGIQGVSTAPEDWGVPNLSFSNFGRLSDSSPMLRRNNSWRLTENFTYNRRRHTFRAGGLLSWGTTALRTNPNPRGSFTFTGQATSGFSGSSPILNTGFDFGDFLLGLPQSTSIRDGQNNTYFVHRSVGVYAQDDIRLNARFSLTLGLRYEFFPPPHEKFNKIANLDVAQWFTAVAPVLPGESGPYTGRFPRGLIDSDRNNFAPRVGFAWRPLKQRIILRGGYAVFYDNTVFDRMNSQMASQPPFATTTSRLTSAARVLTLENPFPPEPARVVKNTFAADRNFVLPYVQTWNFSIQQDLRRGMLIEFGYMGTKGTKLYLIRSPNRAAPGSQLTSEQRRLIGNALDFNYHTSGASSIYHALQSRIHRRFARGVSVTASYTFGRAIDNASSIGGSGNFVAQDDSNLRAERGLSSFDQRHRLDIRYVYEFPFGQRRALFQSGWGARLLGNWQAGGGFTYLGGRPFTPLVGGNRTNNSGSGGGGDRADVTGLPIQLDNPTVNRFFNTDAFAVPAPAHFGNAGRNIIVGPSTHTFNASLGRSFRFKENGPRGEVRLEANDLFNTPVFSGLGTVLNAYNFGRITGARPMRTLQWNVRLTF